MGESAGVKKSNKSAAAATKTIDTAKTDYLNDPMFQQVSALVSNILQNPLTLTPSAVDTMYQQGANQANQAANSFYNERMTQLSGGQDAPGYRSGAARSAEFEAGSRLGQGLADTHRQVQMEIANRRVQDLITAANAGSGLLSQQFNLSQALSNAQMGAANTFGQNAQIPSPLAQTLGGIGGIGGKILGTEKAGGAIFK